jgi:hypothetical protein
MRQVFDQPKPDGKPGELTDFRERDLARIFFKEAGKDAEVTPLAVQDWTYELKTYKVIRNYRIKTKEATMDFRVSVFSSDAEGLGRKWFVNMRETFQMARTMTPFGEGLARLRLESGAQLHKWSLDPATGPFKALAEKDGSDWNRLVPDASKQKEQRALLYQMCAGPAPFKIDVLGRPEDVGRWEQIDGKTRMYHTARLALPREIGGPPAYLLDGYFVLEPVQAVNVEQFAQDPRGELTWNLVRVVFTSMTPAGLEKRPKGPGM